MTTLITSFQMIAVMTAAILASICFLSAASLHFQNFHSGKTHPKSKNAS